MLTFKYDEWYVFRFFAKKIKRELKNITSSKAREVNRLKGNIDRHKHLIS